MKPNFTQNQITETYINSIKSRPTWEGIDSYDEEFFTKINQENNHLNWDFIHHKYRYRITVLIFAVTYAIMSTFLMVGLVPSMTWEHIVSLGLALFTGYAAWDQFSGFYFRYRFGEDTICVRRSENRPEIVYKIVRVTAWFGVAFCIVMGVIFGPMIFVGAGGFALMAFKLINAKEVILINKVKYNSIFFMQLIEEDSVLEILFKEEVAGLRDSNTLVIKEDYNIVTLYVKKSDALRLKETISYINNKVGYEVELINTKYRKDSVNLYEKFRQLNLPLQSVLFDIDKFRCVDHKK